MRRLQIFVFLCLLFTQATAQMPYFPIAFAPDQLSGAPDFGFLNHPLTAADRIFIRDGRFYRVGPDLLPNTADDERVRFFGTNNSFAGNFPDPADAQRIARRLRKLGINLLRLHHMDSTPDSNPNNANGLLTTGPYPTLNQVSVFRLRAFLDALKSEGVYVNLNLHVGYEFRPSVDNVPPMPNRAPIPSQSKPLHIFYPRMVELQKQYARTVIDALQLNDDPVLAMIEINNESSLIFEWQAGRLDEVLQGDYRKELQGDWNDFLRAKYQTTDGLREAWGGDSSSGAELLSTSGLPVTPLSGWRLELHAPAQATFEIITQDNLPLAKVNVATGGNALIFKQTGFSVAATDRPYLAEFEIRADLPGGESRNVLWSVMRDTSPWDGQFFRTVTISNQWQKFSYAFNARSEMNRVGRFGLWLEGLAGTTVYVRNWSLRQAARHGLADGESIESGDVSLIAATDIPTQARIDDYLSFLAGSDRAYLREMLGAIREKVGNTVPIAGTQMGFGGLMNLDSHVDLNYQDNHFYVDHYGFPNTQWDGRDWYIQDRSHLGGGLWALQEMAITREAGRPYTVSEYNQPWPNTYAAEIDPVTAAFAAFQDWDAILHYSFSHSRSWDLGVPSGFDLNSDWTKFPGAGQSAWLFRSGAIDSGNQVIEVPLSHSIRLRSARERRSFDSNGFLNSAFGFQGANSFIHQVRIAKNENAALPESARQNPSQPYLSDTTEMTYDRNGRLFLVHAAKAAGVFGFAASRKVTAGAMDLELASSARGFASVLLTTLDDQPIQDSKRLFLSTPGHTLRTQPGSGPARPQQLVNYPNRNDWWTLEREPNFQNNPSGSFWEGQGPFWMERVESYLTLRTTAQQITVYPLDGRGARLAALRSSDIEKVNGGFRIHLQSSEATPAFWYEILTDADATAAHVSAASYKGERLARESIVAAFGSGLATATQASDTTPLPTTLAGTVVVIKDSAGDERNAPLFFVSPNQVNYQIPPEAAHGTTMITIKSGDGKVATRTAQISPLAPGLFTANASGQGVAAAVVLRIKGDGSQTYEPAAQFDPAQNKFISLPIDLGPQSDRLFLLLFGTGIRHRGALADVSAKIGGVDATVSYAGTQDNFIGLDQINIELPRSLAGRGEVDLLLSINSKPANAVKIGFN